MWREKKKEERVCIEERDIGFLNTEIQREKVRAYLRLSFRWGECSVGDS